MSDSDVEYVTEASVENYRQNVSDVTLAAAVNLGVRIVSEFIGKDIDGTVNPDLHELQAAIIGQHLESKK